uniref:NADH-ubiquinone oxidoreductase chain 4 n=1 Tax=Rhinocola aceris TaxID=1889912 RepID=A0A343KN36_9HEMI|nr:NADH dehydrogenase subunit 4 [Rhinocola aceris]
MLELLFVSLFFAMNKKWEVTLNFLILMLLYLLLIFCDKGEYLMKSILTLLSLWLVSMMLLSVSKEEKKLLLKGMFIFMLWSLQVSFYADSLLLFYIGFEMSILPVLLIILGWGYQPDRLEAGFYMVLYTVFFSLPLLLMILNSFLVSFVGSELVFWLYFMAFLVKVPLFGVHLWLPRAHVEAPVYGSMILAGVMLKLGGYGIFRVILINDDTFIFDSIGLISFSLVGGVILSFICFVQSDMKMLIAYSSIVHMSLVLSGLFTLCSSGLTGVLSMMVGHGFCSSGLFCLLGVFYSRIHSRSLYINKGLIVNFSISTLWWFLFCSSNLSFPPSLNLVGEILLMLSLVSWFTGIFVVLCLLNFFSSMYSIYLYSFCQHGSGVVIYSFKNLTMKELMLALFHWLPLNLLILDLSMMQ